MPADQRILITGVRKGIGRFLAEHYLQAGASVIGCSRKRSDLEHPRFVHRELDVADESAVKEMFSEIRKRYGSLEVLINNAGIAAMNHVLLTPIETVSRIMQTNVVGTFLFCREAAKLMKKAGWGRIVNFTTVAVAMKLEGEAAYAASKAAVETLTAVLARELGDFGITVNAVGPAPVETDLIRTVPREKIDSLIARQAIRRPATMPDIANVIDFFISRRSDLVTGQVVYLGGV